MTKKHQPPSDAPHYRGVSWHCTNRRWRAKIRWGGDRHLNLGYFDSPEEAARAYDFTLRLIRGDDGTCNFNEGPPPPGLLQKLRELEVM